MLKLWPVDEDEDEEEGSYFATPEVEHADVEQDEEAIHYYIGGFCPRQPAVSFRPHQEA